ncbi:MAG TPA: agmatinase [Desulfatiglandales bacterium]|nr:agmatinase [Desulfatiglandales bacterium]
MSYPEPIDAMVSPRYSGIATFFRLPHITDLEKIDIAILGVPFDGCSAYRTGCRMAPREIRHMSAGVRPYNDALKVNPYKRHRIADYGDLSTDPFSIKESFKRIESGIDVLMDADVIPVSVGGDHAVTYPILRAIAKKHGPLALVDIDAHPDTCDSQSGHRFGNGTPFRRALEDNLIIPSKVVQVGIRGTSFYKDDADYGLEKGFKVWKAEEFMSTHIADFKSELHRIVGDTKCYLSFDIDSLDPSAAPATNTPELGGLTSLQGLQIIRSLAGLKLVGADMVEVSPPLDTTSRITSITAAQLLYEIICVI